MKTIGIDPDKKGAIVIIEEKIITAFQMPLLDDKINFHKVCSILIECAHNADLVLVEMPVVMPKKGVASALTQGQNIGKFIGILIAIKVPYDTVHPKTWQSKLHMKDAKKSSKERSIETVHKMYPHFEIENDQDGIADGLLIATYAKRICENK